MYLMFAFLMATLTGDTTANKYIGKQPSDNVIEVYTGKDAYDFKMTPFRQNSNDILQSKSTLYTGVYFQYKWFTFDYSTSFFSPPKGNPEHDIKAFTLGTTYIRDKWGVLATYRKYDGFIMVTNNHRKKTAFPQLKHQAIALDSYFNLNAKKFSMNAAFSYGSKQLKSAGGLSAWLHTDYQRWNILPVVKNNKLQINQSPQQKVTQIYNLIPQLGYGYNWAITKSGFLATALVHAGVGYSYVKDKTDKQMASWLAGWHAQAGYNGNWWYTYFCHEGSFQNYLSSTRFLYNQQISNSITLGHRF